MDIQGIITEILPIKSGVGKSGKEWKSQDYILQTEGQYPKKICFSAFGDKIEEFDIKVGDSLKALIDIDAHEYQGRWYNSIKAFRVNKEMSAQQKVEEQPKTVSPIPVAGDLPF